LVGRLPANSSACSALLAAGGWVGAAASRSVLTLTRYFKQKNLFLIRVRPLAATIIKKFTVAAYRASLV